MKEQVMDKIREEVTELEQAVNTGNQEDIEEVKIYSI
jgi:hypothetical protein